MERIKRIDCLTWQLLIFAYGSPNGKAEAAAGIGLTDRLTSQPTQNNTKTETSRKPTWRQRADCPQGHATGGTDREKAKGGISRCDLPPIAL